MDRLINYPGQLPLDTDLLNTNKNAMLAIAKLSAALLGSSTIAHGLSVGPNSPAALNVVVQPGSIYQLANVDSTAYGSLPPDTTDTVVKQGITLAPTVLSCPAPTTAGFSINYLIEAAFSEVDTNGVTLPFYNAANPAQPWSGPNNTGAQSNTVRAGQISLIAKAGVAATTGTQTTPALDSGYIALAVVTVANGQSTITAGNITTQGANVLPADLFHALQNNAISYAKDTGAANAYVMNLQPAITSLVDGMVVEFQAINANTGASTLNVNGTGAKAIVGGAQAALQGGEIAANGKVQVMWHSALNSWVIMDSTGGTTQVGAGTQSSHAINLGQFTGSNQSLANPGYQRLPGGLIVQWATVNTNGSLTQTVTFPIAFPHAMLADAVVQPDGIIIAGQGATATTRTYTQRVGTGTGAAAGTGNSFNYIAVGW